MSNKFLVSMVTVPLVLAAGLVLVVMRGPATEVGPTSGARGELDGQLGAMRREMQQLRRQVQVMQAQAPSPAAAIPDPAPSAVVPPPTPEQVSARDRRRFEGLAHRLAAEPVDGRWAPAAERTIGEVLRKPVFKGSQLGEATCRTTLCRFDVSHDSEAARSRFASALPTRLPSMPSGSMRHAEGPERRTIVYVAREGHRVPRDDPQ